MLGVQAPSSESFIDVLMLSGQGALLGRLGGDLVLGKDPITDRLGTTVFLWPTGHLACANLNLKSNACTFYI